MRLATVACSRRLCAAVSCRIGNEELWVDIADAARRLLDDQRCPDSLRLLLERDGPQLSTARQVKSEVEAAGADENLVTWPVHGAVLAPPVPDPGAFLDFYAFEEHVRNARARRGLEVAPEWYQYPVYYRSNQRSLLGTGAEVWFPAGETKIDFELELAAVLGAPIESPSAAEAEAAIAGFALLNDWSARAIQAEVMKVGLGPNKGKDFATSCGPWMVTVDELGDLSKLELRARVNHELWSQGSPGKMHWSWGEMLAFAADGVRFEPGDLFGSGTIGGGCGLELGSFLAPGDLVELEGDRLGVLAGTVRQSEPLDSSGDTE